ncbi:hypothetical protein H924_02205 [Corynebacterium callunae DSM 20147]|uniref:Uncharacterized protein n=1 Tax=Corynebacterium callunae DSM 20147 TaxID=1121353 RepID=M1UD97_9CORY|nr:hypothetical protein H924_02205 [Corynebacterium callunae DSM 20147]
MLLKGVPVPRKWDTLDGAKQKTHCPSTSLFQKLSHNPIPYYLLLNILLVLFRLWTSAMPGYQL